MKSNYIYRKMPILFATLLFLVSWSLPIFFYNSAAAASEYRLIDRFFFVTEVDEDQEKESTFTDEDRNNQVLEDYFANEDPRLGTAGYTQTLGLGFNCGDPPNDEFVICDQYYTLNNSSFSRETEGLLIFHNVRKYTDELGAEPPTITYLGSTNTFRVDQVGGSAFDIDVDGDVEGRVKDLIESFIVAPPVDTENGPTDLEVTVAEAESCESKGGDFSFLLCPLIKGADEGIGLLDDKIESSLNVSSDYYAAPEVHAIWGRVRNIANILLIPFLLIMVIATALNFKFVDAYTVKRAIPRLLVAVIFIALSFDISGILVQLSNDFGAGTGGIVAAPFGGKENLQLADIFGPVEGNIGSGVIIGSIAIGAVAGFFSIAIIATYVGGAILALLTIFAVLAMRELAIIFLIILSPLAILSWIFPESVKGWKLWWGTFSKLLLFYPLITGLLMSGRGFAKLIHEIDGSGSIFTFIAKITVYAGTFFLILKLAQSLTGAFGQFTGAVNDRSKGLFDRARKYRGDKRKEIGAKRKAGHRFTPGDENSRAGRFKNRLNRRLEYASNLGDAFSTGINPRNYRRNMQARNMNASTAEAAEFKEKNASFKVILDDELLHAAEFQNEHDIREALATSASGRYIDQNTGERDEAKLDQAVASIKQAQSETSIETFNKARVEALASIGTSYEYDYEELNAATGQMERKKGVDVTKMLNDINGAYGADRAGAASALSRMKNAQVQAGQVAVGKAGFTTMNNMLERLHREDGTNQTQAQREASEADVQNIIYDDALDHSAPNEAIYGKKTSATAMGKRYAARIKAHAADAAAARDAHNNALQNGTQAEIDAAKANLDAAVEDLSASTASASALWDAMRAANPQNAAAFANETMGQEIDVRGIITQTDAQGNVTTTLNPATTIRELIQEISTSDQNKEYSDRYRDFSAESYRRQGPGPGAGGPPPGPGGGGPPGP